MKKKNALITGGSRGISEEAALLLSKRGLNVRATTSSQIDSVVNHIENMCHNDDSILWITRDLGISSEVNSLGATVIESFRSSDLLVNNTGIVFKNLAHVSEEGWDQTIDTNQMGTFRAVLPRMLASNAGVLINTSSGAGKVGFENLSA